MIRKHNERVDEYGSLSYVRNNKLITDHYEARINDVIKSDEYNCDTEDIVRGSQIKATVRHKESSKKYEVIIRLSGHPQFKNKLSSGNSASSSSGNVDNYVGGGNLQEPDANDNFSAMNMSCSCGITKFNMICDHIIVVAAQKNDVNLLRSNINYIAGPFQRELQHLLYTDMVAAEIPSDDRRFLKSTKNVYLPKITMHRAGAPNKRQRIKPSLEVATMKSIRIFK